MSAKDGGAAFPDGATNEWGNPTSGGMSLRDYFAAHAPEVPDMQTFPILYPESWVQREARWAIEYADAMIEARSK